VPRGVIKSNEQVICDTCTTPFLRTHYSSKYCSKPCYHKSVYAKTRKVQLSKGYTLQKAYGITLEDYENMKHKQDHKCLICFTEPKILYVDHCHTNKHVRGLLCPKCNLLLGHAKDSVDILQQAINYLNTDLKKIKGVK